MLALILLLHPWMWLLSKLLLEKDVQDAEEKCSWQRKCLQEEEFVESHLRTELDD